MFCGGSLKTTGANIDKIMPPVSHFGGGNRAAKKHCVIDKLMKSFEKYFGLVWQMIKGSGLLPNVHESRKIRW
ncbi:MAG: hypothetical protein MUP22_08505 [Desulfobacterales bacterium]|nr:hypothetical protein [Desulfobacterales bacterium]